MSKNYWPHGIAVMLILGVIACAWTIKIALDNPVEMSNMFMQKYQNVDDNINDILLSERKFDSIYQFKIINNQLKVGNNNLSFELKKGSIFINNATIKALITRPETTKFDTHIDNIAIENSFYKLSDINISKEGRWIIRLQIDVDGLIVFKDFELLAIN